jgi:hypothetical protein
MNCHTDFPDRARSKSKLRYPIRQIRQRDLDLRRCAGPRQDWAVLGGTATSMEVRISPSLAPVGQNLLSGETGKLP